MRLLLIGINHRTASVALREKLAVAGEQLHATLAALRSRFGDCECVLLSTCNRTELYLARPAHQPPSPEDIRAFLAERSGVNPADVASASTHREQEQVVQHLFRVCCGLESMVLGEPQILGQVKRAYEAANETGAVGPMFHRVFQQAIATGKRLRSTTGIDAGRVSVASVAVDFARQIFENFADKTVVGIGAGEMAKATLRRLSELGPQRLWIVNRSLDRARALADQLHLAGTNGGARPWEDLDEMLVEADVVLTGTGATTPIITAEQFRPLVRRRRNRPLFMVDIAVPRDVDPAISSFSNVYLYNIDDLQQVVSANLGQRHEQVERCERELVDAAAVCYRQVQHRDVSQLIRQLRDQLHDIGRAERDRTARKLAARTPAEAEAMQQLLDEHTHRVINKILHLPLSQLDHKDPDAPLAFYAAALRRLFRLDDHAASPPASPSSSSERRSKVVQGGLHK